MVICLCRQSIVFCAHDLLVYAVIICHFASLSLEVIKSKQQDDN
jgi:hypothetical protein